MANFTKWLTQGLSFLVISCPCALVISVPLAFCLVHCTSLPITAVYLFCQLIDLSKCTIGLLLVRRGTWATTIVGDA